MTINNINVEDVLLGNTTNTDHFNVQFKLQLTNGEFTHVNNTHGQAVLHGQAISIYFTYFQT